jgi:Flp pilus assembly protein TadG
MSAPRLLRRFVASERANAAIEFAFVLPLIISLFAGIAEFGRAFQVYNATNKLASQYAIAWADCSDVPVGACQTELNTLTASNTITNVAPQLTSSRLSITMFQMTMSGTTPVVLYAYPSGATLTASQTTAAQASIPSGQTGVLVAASYTHSLAYFPKQMTTFLGSYLTPSYTIVQLKS